MPKCTAACACMSSWAHRKRWRKEVWKTSFPWWSVWSTSLLAPSLASGPIQPAEWIRKNYTSIRFRAIEKLEGTATYYRLCIRWYLLVDNAMLARPLLSTTNGRVRRNVLCTYNWILPECLLGWKQRQKREKNCLREMMKLILKPTDFYHIPRKATKFFVAMSGQELRHYPKQCVYVCSSMVFQVF